MGKEDNKVQQNPRLQKPERPQPRFINENFTVDPEKNTNENSSE